MGYRSPTPEESTGPWSKYLATQIQAGKDGGYKCKYCGALFHSYPSFVNHVRDCSRAAKDTTGPEKL